MNQRKAYTPREFAALFGKEKSWTYRQIKAGRIAAISEYGRLMISTAEADRILKHCDEAEAGVASGTAVSPRAAARVVRPILTKGAWQWTEWIRQSKKCAPRVKGLRRPNRAESHS